jgi:tetratricopeptide (TPR) repeat protein
VTRRFLSWACFSAFLAAAAVGRAAAQNPVPPPPAPPPPAAQEREPPEEDESLKPKEYTFNPLEASQDVKVGTYYFKKGSYAAARRRFTEATKWDPGMAEAYLRLGETQEKLKDSKAAKAAYSKYLELAPDSKEAESVRKKLARH